MHRELCSSERRGRVLGVECCTAKRLRGVEL